MTIDTNLLADSYDAAADYIEQNGWYQGDLTNDKKDHYESIESVIKYINENQPPVCAMGAAYAVGVTSNGGRCWGIIESKFNVITVNDWVTPLERELGDKYVPDWNDDEAKSAAEVIDLLRMTALKIRAGNIGDNPREYEFEPMPQTEPVVEPAAPQPVKEPQPA